MMIVLKKFFILFAITSITLLASCSSNSDKETYSRNEVNRLQTTLTGTIKQIEVVNVGGRSSWIGTASGSIAGALLGSTIGNGWGRLASSMAGSVLGSVAGGGVEKQITKGQGLKLVIHPEDGMDFSTIIIPTEDQHFQVGNKVKIITSSSGAIQITPLN